MERLNRINEAGTAYLIAETDLSSIRLMGSVGRKYRDAKEKAEAARVRSDLTAALPIIQFRCR